ncbi:zinc finger protein 567-like [Neocloeon triangulifer]|uniref:zinc finger protein 567-like n=1 Tax=Neocloeon triangulifer TaxID=2078957 RepID=UPI00286ECCE9|nr:zinc finger protein 567-like [Neocloeon triangulifer]
MSSYNNSFVQFMLENPPTGVDPLACEENVEPESPEMPNLVVHETQPEDMDTQEVDEQTQDKPPENLKQKFKCGSCSKEFVSKMQCKVHEKLHLQNLGLINKSKLQELTSKKFIVTSAPSSSSDSLLCHKCNVYFRTSTDKQDHICQPVGDEEKEDDKLDAKRCLGCGKGFFGRKKSQKCFKCWRADRVKKRRAQEAGIATFEEIREINGQKVKVIRVKDLAQLSDIEEGEKRELQKKKNFKKKTKKTRKQKKRQIIVSSDEEIVPNQETPDQDEEKVATAPKVTFRCVYCPAVFYFPNILQQHSVTEHNRFHFCKFCLLTFKNKDQENIHNIECGKTKISAHQRDFLKFSFDLASLTCTLCNLTFALDAELLYHAINAHKMNHRDEEKETKVAEKPKPVDKETKGAQELVPKSMDFKCCGITFSSREWLIDHKKKIHRAVSELNLINTEIVIRTEKCEVLSKVINNLSIVPLNCRLCPMITYTVNAHRLHEKSHQVLMSKKNKK